MIFNDEVFIPTSTIPTHTLARVDFLKKRNPENESSCSVKDGRCLRLTTSLPLPADCLENVGGLKSHYPMGLRGLFRDTFAFLNAIAQPDD